MGCDTVLFHSFSGQVSQWVYEYLDAPVSLKEIVDDMIDVGVSHNPSWLHTRSGDETAYRKAMASIGAKVATYNSYFDEHGVDMILIPAAFSPPPTLVETVEGTVPLTAADGSTVLRDVWPAFFPHNEAFKDLHIPKLSVPTGLSEDGRPTGVQLWGRAVPCADMFEDAKSSVASVAFLYRAARVVAAIHADASLRRVEPAIMRPASDSFDGKPLDARI